MSEPDFENLATRVLAGEATAEEAAQLHRWVAGSAKHRRIFEELRDAWTVVQELHPIVQALDAKPQSPPEPRLTPLLAQARDRGDRMTAGTRGWPSFASTWPRAARGRLALGGAAVLLLVGGLILLLQRTPPSRPLGSGVDLSLVAHLVPLSGVAEIRRRDGSVNTLREPFGVLGTDEVTLPAGSVIRVVSARGAFDVVGPRALQVADLVETAAGATAFSRIEGRLRTALFEPTPRLLAGGLLVATRGSPALAVYSPRTATADPTPVIWWNARPDRTYRVTLTDELEPTAPPLDWRGAGPLLRFDQAWPDRSLAPGGLYRLTVRELGSSDLALAEHTFATLPGKDLPAVAEPSERLARALAQLSADPPCLGDALVELRELPLAWGRSHFVLRLRLYAYGQLGLEAEYADAASRISPHMPAVTTP